MSSTDKDIELQCKDCGANFIFTVGQQQFLRDLVADGKIETYNPPARCEDCRAAKKKKYAQSQQ